MRWPCIGDRNHNVVLQFYKKDAEHYGYALSGPVVEGEYRIPVVIAARDGRIPEPDFATGHYSTHELWDMIYRAGRLLNREQHRSDNDGDERFIAALVYHFGKSLSHESDGQTFFSNGARACGMMAGKLAALEISEKNQNPPTQSKGISLLDGATPQLDQGVSWIVDEDGEVCPAINAGEFNLGNGEGKGGRRPPPSDAETIDTLIKMKAAFGNMLTNLSWLEEVIRKPGWRKHDPEFCPMEAVAGWLLLAKRITRQHLRALRLTRLRLSDSICLDDPTAGSSYCELAVVVTQDRLGGVMAMFKPSADVLRSPKVTQMAFYSESLRGIEGEIRWDYPEIHCERLYRLVEMELSKLEEVAHPVVWVIVCPPSDSVIP